MTVSFTTEHMSVLLKAHAAFTRLLDILAELNGNTTFAEGPIFDLMNIEKLIQMVSPLFNSQEKDKDYYDRAFTRILYSEVLSTDEKARLLLENSPRREESGK